MKARKAMALAMTAAMVGGLMTVYEKRIAGIFKKADSFSISYINDCLNEA